MTKTCVECKTEKSLSEFSKDKAKKFGVRGYCKPCDSKLAVLRANKNPDRHKAKCLAWHRANREKALSRMRDNYKQNRSARLLQMRQWKAENRDVVNALHRKRECQKIKATPPWFTKQDYKDTLEFYRVAKELRWLSNEPLQVDHIEPLMGKNVCGLHVPWNLQILPKSQNIAKGNRSV